MTTAIKEPAEALAVVPREGAALSTGLSIFDSGAFDSLYRVAGALAKSTLVPKTLQGANQEQTAANCLRVVEQAARWELSPFAVMDCASVVHGRLMWEGKLVAAVIDASLGIRLSYTYSGSGKDKKVVVSGKFPDESEPRTIEGTVGQWETKGNGSPWENPNNHERQLAYRGAREWARRHSPAVMLGVYSPDEFEPEEMRVATGRVLARETALDPQADLTEPAAEPEAEAPSIDPNPTTTPATGRQKKDRIHRDGLFKELAENPGTNGKRYWIATFDIGGKCVELTTFSESMADALATLEHDTAARLTITASGNGRFALEDYALLETATEEGGLL